MSAFERVIANPHSVAARTALLDEWRQQSDPRAELLELQLRDHRGLGPRDWSRVPKEIRRLVSKHGDEWAKPIGSLLLGFTYELGLITHAAMTGDAFLTHGDEVFRRAPVVELTLDSPVDLARIAVMPALHQIRVLAFIAGDWIDDAGIDSLVQSPWLTQLRVLAVAGGALTERGILRLISVRGKWPNLIYIDVSENPGAAIADSRVREIHKRHYIIGQAGEPLLRDAYAATALTYSMRVEWPPLDSTFLFDDDE